MTFYEQLTTTVLDKLLIAILLLMAGFWLNTKLERLKTDLNLRSDVAKEQRQELGQELSQFYYPIYLRLEKDNTVWKRFLGSEQKPGEEKIEVELERSFILPNHDQIVKIIDEHIDLVKDDQELWTQILKYERHVAVYKALRATGDRRVPLELGEPWPEKFFPLIKERTEQIQAKYDGLLRQQSGESVEKPGAGAISLTR
ncbi:MAG: hypothetical protein ACREQT_18215 [Candidatus Binataceae bacterium]